ncbi:MAG: Wzz/FepE/Etk N-terminal domain-containing protein [Chloroflexota bacterium]
MTINEYLRILWRRGWILALVAVLTAASAFVFSKLQTPIYKSTIYVLVQPARTDFGLTQSAKILLRSYVAWMDTDRVAADVVDALQLDTLPQALRGNITIASDDSRFVIQIDAKNENGDLANDVAKKWAEFFIQWRNEENQKQRKEDRVDAILLDEPRFVTDRPKTSINTVAGGVLGLLIGGVIVFILEYLESAVIRSATDIERQFNLPVLGAIPATEGARKRN